MKVQTGDVSGDEAVFLKVAKEFGFLKQKSPDQQEVRVEHPDFTATP